MRSRAETIKVGSLLNAMTIRNNGKCFSPCPAVWLNTSIASGWKHCEFPDDVLSFLLYDICQMWHHVIQMVPIARQWHASLHSNVKINGLQVAVP